MANAAQYTILITALDKASAVFRKINMNAVAMNAPFAKISRSLTSLAENSGLTKVAQQVEHVGSKFAALGTQVAEVFGPLAGVAGIASAAGLVEISRGAAEFGHQLAIATQKTGVGADQLARWHYAASTVGVDAMMMDRGIARLNRTLEEAASGKNHKALAMFKAMHLAIKDAHGHVKTGADMMGPIMRQFSLNPNFMQQDRAARTYFSDRLGPAMIPFLNLGPRLNELGDAFTAAYGRMGGANMERLQKAYEGWERLSLTMQGFKFTVGAALAPALDKLITPLTKWITTSKQMTATNVAKWGDQLANSLKSIDWKGIGQAAMSFAGVFGAIGRFLGPKGTMLAAGGLIFSPFIAGALSAGGALLKLGWQIGRVGLGIAAFIGEGMLGSFGKAFAGVAVRVGVLASTAFPLLGDAILAVGAALEATPIGWFITGAAAIGGAAFLVWKNWGPISAWFSRMWKDVRAGFTWAKNFMIGTWDDVQPFFQSLGGKLVDVFQWWWNNIIPWVPGANLVKLVIDHWKPITGFFTKLWTDVTAVFRRAWGWLKPIIDPIVKAADFLARWTGKEISGAAHSVGHAIAHGLNAIEQHGEIISRLGRNRSLADLIGRGEGFYNSVNLGARGGYRSGTRDLASMTVAQVMAAQAAHQFNAAGRYQIIGSTMREAFRALHLSGRERFNSATQDRIFSQYLLGSRHPEVGNFLSGKSGDVMAAVAAISREWASVADPATGRSHYAGIGNNRASISAEQMAEALRMARGRGSGGETRKDGPGGGDVARVSVDFKNVPRGTSVRTHQKSGHHVLFDTGVSWA